MSTTINLGKVGITTEGVYDSSKSYEKLSCVLHNGESWVSTKDVPVSNVPEEGSTYWQKMSARGEQGPKSNDVVTFFLHLNLTPEVLAKNVAARETILNNPTTAFSALLHKDINGIVQCFPVAYTCSMDQNMVAIQYTDAPLNSIVPVRLIVNEDGTYSDIPIE